MMIKRTLLVFIQIYALTIASFTPIVSFAAGTTTVQNNSKNAPTRTAKTEDKSIDMDQITMIGGAAASGYLLKACNPKPTDVWLGAGASLVYIYGEASTQAKYEELEGKVKQFTEGYKYSRKLTDEQRKAIEEALKVYEEMKKATETKKSIQNIAMMAYFAAAAMAAYQAYTIASLAMNCKGANITAHARATALCASTSTGCVAEAACIKNQAISTKVAATSSSPNTGSSIATETSLLTEIGAMFTTTATCSSIGTPELTAACGSWSKAIKIAMAGCSPTFVAKSAPMIPYLNISLVHSSSLEIQKNILNLMSNISIDQTLDEYQIPRFTNFENLPLGQPDLNNFIDRPTESYVANRDLIRFLQHERSSTSLNEYNQLAKMYQTDTPEERAVLWSAIKSGFDLIPSAEAASGGMFSFLPKAAIPLAAGVAAFMVLKNDSMVASPVGRAVMWGALGVLSGVAMKKTDDAIKAIEKNIAYLREILNGMATDLNTTRLALKAINQLPNGSMMANTAVRSATSNARTCVTTNCSSFLSGAQTSLAGSGLADLGGGMSGDVSAFGKMVDTIQSGGNPLSGANATAGANLAAKSSHYKKLTKAIMDKINDNRSKDKKAPIAFDAVEKKYNSNLAAAAQKAFGGSSLPTSTASSSEEEKKDKKDLVASVAPGGVVLKGGAGMNSQGEAAPANTNDFNFKVAPEVKAEATAAPLDASSELAHYESSGNDINDSETANIFQVITVRYMKTAYPRFFEDKK